MNMGEVEETSASSRSVQRVFEALSLKAHSAGYFRLSGPYQPDGRRDRGAFRHVETVDLGSIWAYSKPPA